MKKLRLRLLLASLLGCCVLVLPFGLGWSDENTVPYQVQAQILSRIMPFDRNFTKRVRGAVVIVLLEKEGHAESGNAVRQMGRALADIKTIGGLPLRVVNVAYHGPREARASCDQHGAHAAYFSPGLANDMAELAGSFEGGGVLTFAAVEGYVKSGATVGVSLVAGKPQMSIHLIRARAQKIDFPSTVLKLAKVY